MTVQCLKWSFSETEKDTSGEKAKRLINNLKEKKVCRYLDHDKER